MDPYAALGIRNPASFDLRPIELPAPKCEEDRRSLWSGLYLISSDLPAGVRILLTGTLPPGPDPLQPPTYAEEVHGPDPRLFAFLARAEDAKADVVWGAIGAGLGRAVGPGRFNARFIGSIFRVKVTTTNMIIPVMDPGPGVFSPVGEFPAANVVPLADIVAHEGGTPADMEGIAPYREVLKVLRATNYDLKNRELVLIATGELEAGPRLH